MSKGLKIALAAVVAAGLVAVAPAASANDDDKIRRGSCTGNSDWKLKVGTDDGQLDMEFEVDSNVTGQEWRVTLKNDDERFYRRVRTTQAPSGSFEVNKRTENGAGEDTITARARNLTTDEVCRGAITF